jgi:hypothetical protein
VTSIFRGHDPSAPFRRHAVAGLSAAALILVAACSSGGKPAGSGSAPMPPRQALLAAAAFVIDDATGSTAPVPLVQAMARQQYMAL